MDEYGPGYWRDLDPAQDPSWHVWNGQLRPDPTVPGATSLIYIGYSPGAFSGYRDVLVYDYSSTVVSDVLRFWYSASQDLAWIIFYSAVGGGAPADTGIPTVLNVIGRTTENPDGTFYWKSPVSLYEFYGYSEGHASVPEPTTMLLLCLGMIGLAGVRRKLKK